MKHVSSHNTSTQAMIVAKVVDQQGLTFASQVTKHSREIQAGLKLNSYDTASLTAGMGITDSSAIKMRTAMNKKKGWNMLASHRQVKRTRLSELPFGKEAWDFQQLMLSSPREARAFHELRRYHTRPLRLNWGPKNVHFRKTQLWDPNINVRI